MARLTEGGETVYTAGEVSDVVRREVSRLRPRVIKRRRPLFGCCNCFGIFFLLVVGGLGWGVWTLARTGVVTIPVVSTIAYHDPQPVQAVPDTLPSAATVALTGDRQVTITQETLTQLVRERFVGQSVNGITIQSAQVAITPDALELFLDLERPVNGVVTLGVVPTVQTDGQVHLNLQHAQLGLVSLPTGWAQWFIDRSLGTALNRSLGELPFPVTGIQLASGSLTLLF